MVLNNQGVFTSQSIISEDSGWQIYLHHSAWSEDIQASLVTGTSPAVAGRNASVGSFYSVFNKEHITAAAFFLHRCVCIGVQHGRKHQLGPCTKPMRWHGEWWLRDVVHERGWCGSRDKSRREIRVAEVSPFLGKPSWPPSRKVQSEFFSPISWYFLFPWIKSMLFTCCVYNKIHKKTSCFFSAGSYQLRQKSFKKSFISSESVGVLVPAAVSSHPSLLLGSINSHSSSEDCSTAHNKIDSLLIFFLLSFNCSSSWYHLKWTLALRNQRVCH